MEVQRGPVPAPPERRRIPRGVGVAVAGRVGDIHVGHIAAGVGGVGLIILALAGPARRSR